MNGFFFLRLRGSGTAATNMCLVASGAVEAFFEIGIHCWDIAAGAVIVQEAGGLLLDVDGVYALKPNLVLFRHPRRCHINDV